MGHNSATIRVLVADDHPLLREGIAGLIAEESDMTLVAEAAKGREAVEQFRLHRPDVTLMDLQMPAGWRRRPQSARSFPARASSC
jgi:two-component system, NarL family, response regulator